ncbi:UDP-glucose/GDP-mannose dehydrogenase family protein [Radiobacillus kanasensis]|uniref:UDP-glucose dehydrogenase family protein n=1 Tax=Radiobacillus kanasensis TaxID=2844358 RepID=UPI001E64BFDD|nr:UDP-glucose/GDP-mannose dehydrogenase family protein [Radiobacillus kanasensis]UFT98893.1 UDP-glucose/GDP-mannose dehydrogenase family protein [Radiobacillus kanasensis]
MKIAVIGTGYVGLVTGVCLSEIGHEVTCVDVDPNKIDMLRKGNSPIYEEGLEELLQKNLEKQRLNFTTSYEEGLANKDFIYLGVGTPQGDDGSADLRFINSACESIAKTIKNDVIVVTKSTVPVGTNEYIKNKINNELVNDVRIEVVSNPEFLRQGTAVYDTFNGDRIVIGSESEEALNLLEEINKPFGIPIVKTNLRSAEMIKYAANAFLATKISFINEIANLSEKLGANIEDVASGIGTDKRIGNSFLNAGIGYGGSCFPKDTNALISIGKNVDFSMPILQSVVEVNKNQRRVIVDKIINRFGGLRGLKIALLGLTFKPDTDDMRESPSIQVSEELVKSGAKVFGYDPVGLENARKILTKDITFVDSIESAINDADCAVILTDWKIIKEYKLEEYKKKLKNPIIFDGRNCFSLEEAKKNGIEYYSIGRPSIKEKK